MSDNCLSLNSRTKVYSGLIFYDNFPANTRRWRIAGLMLAHRLRRWNNIIPTLGQRFVFAGLVPTQQTRGIHPMLFQCWVSVEGGVPTLLQQRVNPPCFQGSCNYRASLLYERISLFSTPC